MKSVSVRFALERDNDVHTVPSRHEYSYEEKAKIWLTREEYKIMKNETYGIVQVMDSNRHPRSRECTRGLEFKTEKGAMNKKIAILDGICAVLLEQENQRQEGIHDARRIRKHYIEMNEVYVRAAAEQGSRDSRHAEEEEDEPALSCFTDKNWPVEKGRGRIRRLLLFKGRQGNPRDSIDMTKSLRV
jgi:hypothetical protein